MISEKNLVWIDLEMSGLQPDRDKIIEIATIITDDQLNVLEQGPALVIHQPDEVLENMNDWCKEHHAKSGLTKEVKKSDITLEQAEERTLNFISQYCKKNKNVLAGNTIWQDRNFLYHYMPRIVDFMHYRLLDVSSIKEVVMHWYSQESEYKKNEESAHRALDDIKESIEELKYYREKFFL